MLYTIGPVSLRKVCPSLTVAKAEALAVELGTAMQKHGITEPAACAHFISQCAHESGEFLYIRELWGPSAAQRGYWRRRDIQGAGPLYPRLGYTTRGAGWIQTTGRVNFKRAAKALGVRYSTLTRRANRRGYASLMAAVWWSQNMPSNMSAWNVARVTRRVNGGYNGLDERRRYHGRAAPLSQFLTPRPVRA